MADLTNVHPELKARIQGVQTDAQGRFWITTGWRSLDEQRRLWNSWQAALREYGPRKARDHAPLAAYPGSSMHGRMPSEAVDLACLEADQKLRSNLFKKWGLITPVPGELWHAQLGPNRGAMPFVTKEIAMTLVIEAVGATAHPSKSESGWCFGRRGQIYAFGSAGYFGGWAENEPGPTDRSGRDCVALVSTVDGRGYFLVSDAGEVYAYGTAIYPGGYRASEWGKGVIIGAIPNRRHFNGGVSLIRDDGIGLNTYALPA